MRGRSWRRPSLRWTMLVTTLVSIAAGFTGFGFYVDRVEHRSRIADVDAELVRAERAFIQRRLTNRGSGGDPAVGPTSGPDTAPVVDIESPVRILVDPDGRTVVADAAPNPFDAPTVAALTGAPGVRSLDRPRYRARTTALRDGRTLVIALPLANADSSRDAFRRALVAGGVVTMGVQALVVWLLTTLVIRPVTRMTRTATRIAGGALDTPVEPPSGSRETAELAIDLDRMLTRLRTALADSERSAAQAAAARNDLQRFLADVSHEVRTPLTALRGYSDLYERGMLDDQLALDRAMSRIGRESERLHGLVDNMMRLARDQRPTATVVAFDVAAIAHDVVDDLRSAHPARHLSLDADPSSNHQVDGTPASIHQAILNVVSNACQHTPPDTTIELIVRTGPHDVTIHVIDHGPGIDARDSERVFLPFFQLDLSRSRSAYSGAGLGLALTKQIIDHHHGSITVTTTPGGGCTFAIVLPRHQPENATPMSG